MFRKAANGHPAERHSRRRRQYRRYYQGRVEQVTPVVAFCVTTT